MIKKLDKEELLEMISEAASQLKTIQGFPSELPVGVDRTKALERYRQEMASFKAQIANAPDSQTKAALQGQLQDVTDEHEALAKSPDAAITESGILTIRKIFEEKGLSLEDRIETLETLLSNFILKDDQGAGYVDRLDQLQSDVDKIDQSLSRSEPEKDDSSDNILD